MNNVHTYVRMYIIGTVLHYYLHILPSATFKCCTGTSADNLLLHCTRMFKMGSTTIPKCYMLANLWPDLRKLTSENAFIAPYHT